MRERIGQGREIVEVPPEVGTVEALREWLASRGAGHAAALGDASRIRSAIDDRFVPFDEALDGAREVSFFPPVTGG